MTTLHIDLDEMTAEAIRDKARHAGKTPEVWAAELLVEQAVRRDDNRWIERFLEDARDVPGNSGGWQWNRKELYDR